MKKILGLGLAIVLASGISGCSRDASKGSHGPLPPKGAVKADIVHFVKTTDKNIGKYKNEVTSLKLIHSAKNQYTYRVDMVHLQGKDPEDAFFWRSRRECEASKNDAGHWVAVCKKPTVGGIRLLKFKGTSKDVWPPK